MISFFIFDAVQQGGTSVGSRDALRALRDETRVALRVLARRWDGFRIRTNFLSSHRFRKHGLGFVGRAVVRLLGESRYRKSKNRN